MGNVIGGKTSLVCNSSQRRVEALVDQKPEHGRLSRPIPVVRSDAFRPDARPGTAGRPSPLWKRSNIDRRQLDLGAIQRWVPRQHLLDGGAVRKHVSDEVYRNPSSPIDRSPPHDLGVTDHHPRRAPNTFQLRANLSAGILDFHDKGLGFPDPDFIGLRGLLHSLRHFTARSQRKQVHAIRLQLEVEDLLFAE